MSNEYRQVGEYYDAARSSVNAQSSFINQVYGWMTAGLALSALAAWWICGLMFSMTPEELAGVMNWWIVLFIVELGLVMGISWGINRINSAVAGFLFVLYSLVNGVTLAPIALVYTKESLSATFIATGATFGVMSLYGYVTKRDLTSLGNLCMMGLFGFIIGTVINIFWANSSLYWVMTYLGIAVFVGLTAYDTQKIKQMSQAAGSGELAGENARKGAILGALALYLDFINLFLLLLRFFGNRR